MQILVEKKTFCINWILFSSFNSTRLQTANQSECVDVNTRIVCCGCWLDWAGWWWWCHERRICLGCETTRIFMWKETRLMSKAWLHIAEQLLKMNFQSVTSDTDWDNYIDGQPSINLNHLEIFIMMKLCMNMTRLYFGWYFEGQS